MARKEPVILALGHSKAIRLYVLPMSWESAIASYYGGYPGHADEARFSLRDVRSEAVVAPIVMDQYTDDGIPLRYGVITVDGADAAFVVPANAYWRALVESGEEQ